MPPLAAPATLVVCSLQSGPRLLGILSPGEHWTLVVKRHLQSRIAEYSESEIRFNLLALVKSSLLGAEEHIARILERLRRAYAALEAAGVVGDSAPPDAIACSAGINISNLPHVEEPHAAAVGIVSTASEGLIREYEDLQRALTQAAIALEM